MAKSSNADPDAGQLVAVMLQGGATFEEMMRETGLSKHLVRREAHAAMAHLKTQGIFLQCTCGKERLHRFGCGRGKKTKISQEQVAAIHAMVPTASGYREISRALGLNQDTVRRHAAPILAELKRQGRHPVCECGEPRFHHGGCVANIARRNLPADFIAFRPRERWAPLSEQRRKAIELLVAGFCFFEIDEKLRLPPKSARSYAKYLSADQRTERERALSRRGPIVRKSKARERLPFRPFSDDLYARIAAATPRFISDSLRDDVISEVYLAVIEGEVHERDIAAAAKGRARKAKSDFESNWAPRSLDERLTSESNKTIGEMIEDPNALAAFERLDGMLFGQRLVGAVSSAAPAM